MGWRPFSPRLLIDVAGMSLEEVTVLLVKVRAEVKDPDIHMQFDLLVSVPAAQKWLVANLTAT